MAHLTWSRKQIALGQVFEKDGLLYKVIGLIDEPVAVLAPLDERDGQEHEHHVITSAEFSDYALIQRTLPGGTMDEWKPGQF